MEQPSKNLTVKGNPFLLEFFMGVEGKFLREDFVWKLREEFFVVVFVGIEGTFFVRVEGGLFMGVD